MSMSQFNKWLRSRGVRKLKHGYALPCQGDVSSDRIGEESVKAEASAERETMHVTISTRGRDRHGDILEPAGVELAGYLRNPVVLWAHDYTGLPIGKAVSVDVGPEAIRAEIAFAETDFAREARQLYEGGFLRGWSVGFLPREWDVLRDANKKFAGYHIKKWELLELSGTPVPANPEALTNALEAGLVGEPALVKSLRSEVDKHRRDAACDEPTRVENAETSLDEAKAVLGELRVSAVNEKQTKDSTSAFTEAAADKPEVSEPRDHLLLARLAPALTRALRAELADRVAREIRRRQGKLD